MLVVLGLVLLSGCAVVDQSLSGATPPSDQADVVSPGSQNLATVSPSPASTASSTSLTPEPQAESIGVSAVAVSDPPEPRLARPYRGSTVDPWLPGACRKPQGLPTRMDPELARRVAAAKAGARAAGLSLSLTSGFRTWEEQAAIYAQKVRLYGSPAAARRWALPPQESTHVMGMAVDLGDRAAASWLAARGPTYGLCRRYANEWWHFEQSPLGQPCPAPLRDGAAVEKQVCP